MNLVVPSNVETTVVVACDDNTTGAATAVTTADLNLDELLLDPWQSSMPVESPNSSSPDLVLGPPSSVCSTTSSSSSTCPNSISQVVQYQQQLYSPHHYINPPTPASSSGSNSPKLVPPSSVGSSTSSYFDSMLSSTNSQHSTDYVNIDMMMMDDAVALNQTTSNLDFVGMYDLAKESPYENHFSNSNINKFSKSAFIYRSKLK